MVETAAVPPAFGRSSSAPGRVLPPEPETAAVSAVDARHVLDGPAQEPRVDPSLRQEELVEAAFEGRLRELVPAPTEFSFSAFSAFRHCPLSYALKYVCGLEPPGPIAAFAFGSAAHKAFELFTRERRVRAEEGLEPPDRSELERLFAEAWADADLGDEKTKVAWTARIGPMLDAFWKAESQRQSATVEEEVAFRLEVELADGAEVELSGVIDRLDQQPDGSVDLVDYKTGPAWGPAMQTYALQLAIYALGCRDALGLGVPRRGLLYFVEHGLFAVKPLDGAAVDATRREVAERATAIRDSDFAATPSPSKCRWCDFRTICPRSATGRPDEDIAARSVR